MRSMIDSLAMLLLCATSRSRSQYALPTRTGAAVH